MHESDGGGEGGETNGVVILGMHVHETNGERGIPHNV